LIRNNELLKKDADDKDSTLKVLSDQVRDLMFFLEAREKVKDGTDSNNNNNPAAPSTSSTTSKI
jgi:hypothetical protein